MAESHLPSNPIEETVRKTKMMMMMMYIQFMFINLISGSVDFITRFKTRLRIGKKLVKVQNTLNLPLS